MFTAMRNGEGDTRHELAGAQDIIHKPFAPDRLAERIERVLASETCTLSRDDGKTIRLVRVIDDGRRSPPA
jgi:DNA-binding response OmpR family regulator